MIENDEDLEPFLVNPLSTFSNQLPIHANKPDLLYSIHSRQVTIVVGPTGSGKSTQIPKYLYDAGWTSPGKSITVCRPRRIAAISLARRLSEELSCEVGSTVGYSVRFEDKTDPDTRVRYMTDGLLLRELLYDPLLSKCSVVVLDEAHERSVATELLAGLLKRLLKHRPDLRLVISSATIDAEAFQTFFTEPDTPTDKLPIIIGIKGRTFPVEVHYLLEPCHDYVDAAIETIFSVHAQMPLGDILVFMTGLEEINRVVDTVNAEAKDNLVAIPLHASMNLRSQASTLYSDKSGRRKVIVATNIAEASLTIDNVGYVIDSGRVKIRCHDVQSSADIMLVTWCSKASANQRAGRAGRVFAGHAYRLYTKEEYVRRMSEQSIPELHKCELSGVLLQVCAMGIDKVAAFELPSGWPNQHIRAAVENLVRLGVFDPKTTSLSTLGLQMAELPLDPAVSRLLLAGNELQCLTETLAIASFLAISTNSQSPLEQLGDSKALARFAVEQGDLLTMLNIFSAYMRASYSSHWCQRNRLDTTTLERVKHVRNLLHRHLSHFRMKLNTERASTEQILKAIVKAYAANVAKADQLAADYTLTRNPKLHASIHPSSVLFEYLPEYVIYTDITHTTKLFMRHVTEVKPEWIVDSLPGMFSMKRKQRK